MELPKINIIIWLVRKKKKDIESLGFFRDSLGGFYTIGGPTGSHCAGHGESWKDKWNHYIKTGFLTLDIAQKNNIIPKKWNAPELLKEDKIIIDNLIRK